jgi:large subunit ribosomal protein L4e
VFARGHRVSEVPQVPLVLSNDVQSVSKTSKAVAVLKAVGAYADVEKAKASTKIRAGQGKMRNRRHVQRRGPLIVYNTDNGITRAFRNLPGVDLAHVSRLNLLQLAPGGHLGRFVVFTQEAFEQLDSVYGTHRAASEQKSGFVLPRAVMTNADLTRLINSDEVQSKVRAKVAPTQHSRLKKNPLKNLGALVKLNPYALAHRRQELKYQASVQTNKAAKKAASKKSSKAHAQLQKANYARLVSEEEYSLV